MKKILGLALGLTMIALTPAVGNAASMIEAVCKEDGSTKKPITFLFDISGGKQILPEMGEADISFTENTILAKNDKLTVIFKFKENIVLINGENFLKCKYKNLELIKQALLNENKKPVSTSVQQRLQALEERMDRLESSLKK
jgi:hypothetical protein